MATIERNSGRGTVRCLWVLVVPTPHPMTYGTPPPVWRCRRGANVKAVQKMPGHASAAMTLDIYADLFDDDLEAVATALHDARSRENVGTMWARGGQEL
jgi:integrase